MKDLLVFARPPQPHPRSVDLLALVRVIVELLGADPSLRTTEIRIEGGTSVAFVDAEPLKIVFHKLLVNATQAIQGGGTVVVTVESHADRCRVAVRDSGPGIPPSIREQNFTPFFTSKARGTGLGLPTAKRTSKRIGARLRSIVRPAVARSS